jgi:hypothetical protein
MKALYWKLRGWWWIRQYGKQFVCRTCKHRFWAVPAQHGFENSCPRCCSAADGV